VAARFTLDAMPGKQMGVDSDLNAGLINEQRPASAAAPSSAKADFYGAMDGATKFVRGDAVAGIIITIVNISVGLIIGVCISSATPIFRGGRNVLHACLTIGDGLVSQIPQPHHL
jgi:flagellar biosynthesis protein FlhA